MFIKGIERHFEYNMFAMFEILKMSDDDSPETKLQQMFVTNKAEAFTSAMDVAVAMNEGYNMAHCRDEKPLTKEELLTLKPKEMVELIMELTATYNRDVMPEIETEGADDKKKEVDD